MFSPDGSRLMFVRADRPAGPFQIMLANPDGRGIRTLSDPLTGLEWVAWSPDGSRLAVISDLEGVKALWILAMNGNAVRLTGAGLTAESVQWRPDGRGLVFRGVTSDTGRPTYGLYAIGANGGSPRAIVQPTDSSEDWQNPALSPDGTRIIYTQWDPDTGGGLWVVPTAGGPVKRLVFDGPLASEYFASWSADGAKIVFHRWSGDYFHLAVAPADGGVAVEIGPAMLQSGGAAFAEFSPDGSKVIARYNPDASIWILDLTGGEPTQLPASDFIPSWQRLAR
jgi:TolB protein